MNRIQCSSVTALLAGTAFLLNASPVESQNPFTAAADIAEGERIFQLDCAICHGGDARGGEGTRPHARTLSSRERRGSALGDCALWNPRDRNAP